MNKMTLLLFGLLTLITHFIESISGFGSTILALPFTIMLIGMKVSIPVLMIQAWMVSLYIFTIDFKNIVWKELLKMLFFMAFGLPIGIFLFNYYNENILKKILSMFMIIISIRGLYISLKKDKKMKHINKHIMNLILFFSGIIHGAFGSGGPFVVIYSTKALPHKSSFRATMSTLWLTLNTIMIFKNIKTGIIDYSIIKLVLLTIPFLIIGIILGNYVHHKIKDDLFIRIVYIILLLSGIFMFVF